MGTITSFKGCGSVYINCIVLYHLITIEFLTHSGTLSVLGLQLYRAENLPHPHPEESWVGIPHTPTRLIYNNNCLPWLPCFYHHGKPISWNWNPIIAQPYTYLLKISSKSFIHTIDWYKYAYFLLSRLRNLWKGFSVTIHQTILHLRCSKVQTING